MLLKDIVDDLKTNGGLKVSLVDALSSLVDSVEARRPLVEATFKESGAVTTNVSWTETGFKGTSMVLLAVNCSALTLDGGTNVTITLRKLMPDGSSYDDIAAFAFTTTAYKVFLVPAVVADEIYTRTSLGIGTGNTQGGPWGDTLRVTVTWVGGVGGSETATLDVRAWAI